MEKFLVSKHSGNSYNDIPMIPPLFFVVLKCRHLAIRLKARELIKIIQPLCLDNDFWKLMRPLEVADALIALENKDLGNTNVLTPEEDRISIFEFIRVPAVGTSLQALKVVDKGDGVRRVERRIVKI